jgi:hypothetical protein
MFVIEQRRGGRKRLRRRVQRRALVEQRALVERGWALVE